MSNHFNHCLALFHLFDNYALMKTMSFWRILIIIVPIITLVELDCEQNDDCDKLKKITKRNAIGTINERTYKMTEIYKDSIKELSSPTWPRYK